MTEGQPVERLSAADASNVVMDAPDQVNAFLLAGTLRPGGFVDAAGQADLGMVRAVIGARLDQAAGTELRRFAQRVRRTGRRLSWERCVPDMGWHVRQADRECGPDGLAALCATLMTSPMPTGRPLWELLIVPGAGVDGPGIVLRVHHAVVDGVGGVRLAQRLFDAPAGTPAPTGHPGSAGRPMPAARPPQRRSLRNLAISLARLSALFRPAIPPTVLLGDIGPHRAVVFADAGIAGLAAGAKTVGGTVNDALLGAVAAAVGTSLRAAGEPVPPTLPASVPVALADRGASGNAVGVMVVPLPTQQADPGVRVARIAGLTGAAKDEARAQGTFELTRTQWGSRLFAALARRQRFVAVFVTNVRGPGHTLQLAGAPLAQAWPVAPIQGNVRLGVAAFSYAGRLNCAVHMDADALAFSRIGSVLGDELARIAGLTE